MWTKFQIFKLMLEKNRFVGLIDWATRIMTFLTFRFLWGTFLTLHL
jgi:hypothetical protein